jgi:hypothetical protein
MRRLLLISGMALQLALACTVEGAVDGTPCAERCPGDDARGQCPPGCATCACCHHASVFEVSVEPAGEPLTDRAALPPQPHLAPRSPAPGQLLRPPILALA